MFGGKFGSTVSSIVVAGREAIKSSQLVYLDCYMCTKGPCGLFRQRGDVGHTHSSPRNGGWEGMLKGGESESCPCPRMGILNAFAGRLENAVFYLSWLHDFLGRRKKMIPGRFRYFTVC